MDIPLGIVVQRVEVGGQWAHVAWRPAAAIFGMPSSEAWRLLAVQGRTTLYYAGRLSLKLHPDETEAYRANLASDPPRVFVVLRRVAAGDAPGDVRPLLVTAAAYEAECYLDGGEDVVEPVPMPAPVVGLIQRFIDAHHVERPFIKRRRRNADAPREA